MTMEKSYAKRVLKVLEFIGLILALVMVVRGNLFS